MTVRENIIYWTGLSIGQGKFAECRVGLVNAANELTKTPKGCLLFYLAFADLRGAKTWREKWHILRRMAWEVRRGHGKHGKANTFIPELIGPWRNDPNLVDPISQKPETRCLFDPPKSHDPLPLP
jgi:hypothetical protein